MTAGARTRTFGRTWTPEEDRKLLLHVAARGTRQWRTVVNAGLLPGRDSKACCNRFIVLKRKYFIFRERLQGQFHPLLGFSEDVFPLQKTPEYGSDNVSIEAALADLANNIDTAARAAPESDNGIIFTEYAAPAPAIEAAAASESALTEYGSPGVSTGSNATATQATAADTSASAADGGNPSSAAAANAAAAAAACVAREAGLINLLLVPPQEPAHELTGVHLRRAPVGPAAQAAVPAAAPAPAPSASAAAAAAAAAAAIAVLNVPPLPTLHETEHWRFHTETTNRASQETAPDLQHSHFEGSDAGRFLEAALLDLINRTAASAACNQADSLPSSAWMPVKLPEMCEGRSSFDLGADSLALEERIGMQGMQNPCFGNQEAGSATELPGTFPALDDSDSVGELLASLGCWAQRECHSVAHNQNHRMQPWVDGGFNRFLAAQQQEAPSRSGSNGATSVEGEGLIRTLCSQVGLGSGSPCGMRPDLMFEAMASGTWFSKCG